VDPRLRQRSPPLPPPGNHGPLPREKRLPHLRIQLHRQKRQHVIPSTWLSLHDPEAYPSPDVYDPERWISGTAEEQGKNWLVFGTGPHYCLGQTYAVLNLMCFLHMLASELEWSHTVTARSEEIRVFATIFPMDDLLLSFSRRGAEAAVAGSA